ncbi:VWA domain-containing protein [Streptomyces sp. NPDC057362]|uniref:vWA domain-containing protein n=1 Tax=Streptomyces sp. NPDC057362 TaxID=3346106 RepID=UPI00362C4FB8
MNEPQPPPRVRRARARAAHRAAAGLAALVLTAVTAVVSGTSPAAARAAAGPAREGPTPGRSEVYSELGLDQVPGDYVVLVDVSGSMLDDGRYSSVRSALLPFLKGLAPQDYVALFTFGDKAETVYLGHPTDPQDIIGRLPAQAGPSGVRTDIGAALDRGLAELERPDAAEVGSVVMFTDGRHEPAAGSKYPKSQGAAWNALRDRAEKLAGPHELSAYSLPLATDESGTAQLARVVRDTTELRPDSVQNLADYLGRAAERTRARKAARLIAQDAGKGVVATLSPTGALDVGGAGATATLTLTATTERVPLTVTGLKASLDGQPFTVTGLPDRVDLKPGTARRFEVQVRGEPDDGVLPVRRTWEDEVGLTVHGKVATPWAAALDDVTFEVPAAVKGPEKGLRLRAEVGSPLALPLLIGVPVVVLLAVLLLWLRRDRAVLSGVLILSPALGDGPLDHIVLRGRRPVLAPPQIGGSGRVHGRRFRADDGTRGIVLHLRYSPDGTSARSADAVCRPDDTVVINGIRFTYRPDRDGRAEGPVARGAGGEPEPLPIPGPEAFAVEDDGPWPSAPPRPPAQRDRPPSPDRDRP